MILKTLDFKPFFKHIENIFSKHFSRKETQQIMEYVVTLSDANFRCYKANMLVIEERKKEKVNDKLISEMEWVARSVGEYRVASKARINKYISDIKTTEIPKAGERWTSDDVVYSIGEMIDRLSIETIKRVDFSKNKREAHMTESSQNLCNRVEKYLIQKLEEIDKKGFYECVDEQRTYDLEGIEKDLALDS